MSYTNGLDKPDLYFNTKLYTGNGGSQSITGVGFQPDLTWIKERNNAHDASIMDVVRGVRKSLTPSNTEAEYTETTGLSSWDSDGFSFDGAGFDHVNTSGDSFASWNWLASNTTASNTDGSITSTVSANTTSGFSIVSYTGNATAGATIGHGLGVAPSMFIIKNRSSGTTDWAVYNKNLGSGNKLLLNSTASSSASSYFNSTSPTSAVFSVNDSDTTNGSGNSHIAYCFAEKKGFSKFGSYTGNGSSDGTFVYTGFKPAFLIIKRTDDLNEWIMRDNKRDTFNPTNHTLYANLSSAEVGGSGEGIDLLSNGFKIKITAGSLNASGGSYIYMCFAESPFTTSTGIPTTAR